VSPARPTPLARVFGERATTLFGELRSGIEARGINPRDRDAFLLVREVAELLRALKPDRGSADTMPALVAFLQFAYLFWSDGEQVRVVSEAQLGKVLGGPGVEHVPSVSVASTGYVQLPELRVWGSPLPGEAPEPLDGWFVRDEPAHRSLLAVFGLYPGRPGFTTVETAGPRPAAPHRADGSALFSPTLAGGSAAGLASITGEAELLELAWRVERAP
jgi:hypothetical protein